MAQNTFTPAGSETHLNARQIWNGNATDAEARLTALESGSAGAATLESVTTNGATTTNDIQVGKISTLHPTVPANNNIASGNSSASIGGTGNKATGNRAVTVGGRLNQANGTESSTFGGFTQIVRGVESEAFGGSNITLNTKYTNTVGGFGHVVGLATTDADQPTAKHSITVGGEDSIIKEATHSSIVGGETNKIQTGHHRSVILGGTGITTDAADTVYVPNINVKDGFKMPTGATDGHVLTTDANGVGTWQAKEIITPQVVTSSGGALTWDHSQGSTIKITLSEDVTSVSISNVVEGDSGLIVLQQNGSGPWTFGGPSLRVLAGDLAVIASDMPTASFVCTIGWYWSGSLLYAYVSEASITSL